MNILSITGFIHFKPHFERDSGHKVVLMTIRSVDKSFKPNWTTILDCRWYDPPDKYWRHPDIKKGTLVYAEGPLHGVVTSDNDVVIDVPSHQKITFFKILNTEADFLEMKARAMEVTRPKKFGRK